MSRWKISDFISVNPKRNVGELSKTVENLV